MFPLEGGRSSGGHNNAQNPRHSPSFSSATRQGPGGSGGVGGGPSVMNQMDAKSSVSGKRVDIKGLLPSNALEKTLFQVAHITTTDTEMSTPVTWALAIIEQLQSFTFPFSANLHPDMPPALEAVLDLFVLPSDYDAWSITSILSIVIVFLVLSLISVVVVLTKRRKVPIALLRLLRFLCALIMNVLNIPITTVLLLGLNCSMGILPGMNGVSCTSERHIPFLVFNSLALVAFVPLLFIGATIFIDTAPTAKDNPLAKPDGMLDVQNIFLRLVLVALKVFTSHLPGVPTFVFLVIGTVGLAWDAWQMITWHPHYDERMNQLRAGMSMGSCLAMLTTLILHLTIGQNTGIWWTLLVPVSLLGILLGALASKLALKRFLRTTITEWRKIYKLHEEAVAVAAKQGHQVQFDANGRKVHVQGPVVALKPATSAADLAARIRSNSMLMLNNGGGGNGGSRAGAGGYRKHLAVGSEGSATASGVTTPAVYKPGRARSLSSYERHPSLNASTHAHVPGTVAGGGGGGSAGGESEAVLEAGGKKSKDSLPPLHNRSQGGGSMDSIAAFLEHRPAVKMTVFDSPRAVEICARVMRDNPSPKQTSMVLQLLEFGLREFPLDAQLLLLTAAYLEGFFGQEGEQASTQIMQVLQSGKIASPPPMHIRFQIYCRERRLRDQGKHVLDSAAIDLLMHKVRRHHIMCLCAVRDLWEAIRVGASESAVIDVVSRLARYKAVAEKCYQRLLEKDGKSKNVLRMYSSFCALVLANTERANQVRELAEELEIMETCARTGLAETMYSTHEATTYQRTNVPFPEPNFDQGADSSFIIKSAPMLDTPVVPPPPPSIMSPTPPAMTFERRVSVAGHLASVQGSVSSLNNETNSDNGENDPKSANQVSFNSPKQLDSREFVHLRPKQVSTAERMLASSTPAIGPTTDSHPSRGDTSPQFPTHAESKPDDNPGPARVSQGVWGGSQASGASHASHATRKRAAKRRLLVDRVESPLNQYLLMAVPGLLLAGSMILGFVLLQHLYQQTGVFISIQFESARGARIAAQRGAAAVRAIVHSNAIGSEAGFRTAYATAESAATQLMTAQIPVLSSYFNTKLPFVPETYRMYLKQSFANGTIDFTPLDVTALGAVERLTHMTNLALGYSRFGQLTQEVASMLPEMTWYSDNMAEVMSVLKEIIYTFLKAYEVILSANTTYVTATASVSFSCLVLCFGVVYWAVFKQYFLGESKLVSLLRQVPRKPASHLVTSLEEELESLRDILDGDDTAAESNEDLDLRLEASTTAAVSTGLHKTLLRRREKYYYGLWLFTILLVASMASMYFFTLSALDKVGDLQLLLKASDRRNNMGQFVSWTREFVSPARCVSEAQLVRDMRGKLLDIAREHALLTHDRNGLSAMVPEHTILPRSCAAPNSCPGLVINASIGLTRQVAELSLNQAIQHFLELGTDVVTAMATKLPGSNLASANPDAYRKYMLLNTLSDDVLARLVSLNSALSNYLNARVQQNMMITATTFVTFMVVLVTGAVVLVHVALRVLRQESRALTTLPFMLPQSAAAMVPELMAFVESGGLQLRSSDSTETVAVTTR